MNNSTLKALLIEYEKKRINAENIAHGSGITETYYKQLLDKNVNVITLGNHAFRNNDIHNFIQNTSEEYSNFVLANHKRP